jgi:glycine/D-amino acid oxidase-like deaminating enzyme
MQGAVPAPVWHEGQQRDWVIERAPVDRTVDVAIIGGGLSGLWTAYYLACHDPGLSIAVLESRRVGFGASGRNGGWCSGFFPLLPSQLAEEFGVEPALAAYRESFRTLDEIERVITNERIDCGWHRGGTVQSATTALQAERLARQVAAQHEVGLTVDDVEWLPTARVAEHIRPAVTHGAVFSPHCATINPYSLVLGLARAARRRGVTIWEETPVRGFAEGTVTHDAGVVRASLVVQATEGYSASFRATRRALVPLYSLMVATEPLDTATIDELGWHNRATFNDGGQMIIYAQLTSDRRIAFGGRGAPYHFSSRVRDEFDIDDATHDRIVKSIARHFPAAATARITHRWGGPLGVPRDWTPSVTIDRASRYARIGGYVGDGVAATNLFARMLVETWTDQGTSLTRLPFVRHQSPKWEVEPLRFLGINSLLKLSDSIDEFELRHGRVPRLRTKLFESLL